MSDDVNIEDRLPVHLAPLEIRNYTSYDETLELSTKENANLISSLTVKGKHKPVLDLDIPHQLVSSATDGHSHLYIDLDLTHDQYQKVLEVLHEVGIIQTGFLQQFYKRGATFVRPPWRKKKTTPVVEEVQVNG